LSYKVWTTDLEVDERPKVKVLKKQQEKVYYLIYFVITWSNFERAPVGVRIRDARAKIAKIIPKVVLFTASQLNKIIL